MTPFIDGAMLTAASIVAKATIITAVALTGAVLARRSRAALRHALLAAAFGALLVLPIASMLAPPVRIIFPAPAQPITLAYGAATGTISSGASLSATVGAAAPVPRVPELSPSSLLLTGWIAGAVLFLLPVILGLWQVRSLRRSALPWPHGQAIAEKLALAAGIQRRIQVLLHDALPGPMTCGFVHPAIVLSQDAQTWNEEDINRAIVHELEHVRRGDWMTHCLARTVYAAYWFHPLVWVAWRRLRLEEERSCDDAVLARSEPAAYADQLVGLARRLSLAARTPAPKPPLLAMANRADLATRVHALLDKRQRRGRAGKFSVALACAAAAVLVLTMAPLTVVAAPQSAASEASTTPLPRFSADGLLVIEAVTASDSRGRPIEGLTANDFAITEDGLPQSISIFEFQKLDATPQATQSSVSSYYVLGYYTKNQTADGNYRKVKITGKADAIAKLDYRPGYYASKRFVPVTGASSGGVRQNSINFDGSSPVLTYKRAPEYSDAARKAKYQGAAVLTVEVDASGHVTNSKVVRSLGLGLDEKALEAVQQWTFMPAMKDGKPVPAQVEVQMNFRLL